MPILSLSCPEAAVVVCGSPAGSVAIVCVCVCVYVSRKTANRGPSLGASYVLGLLVRAPAPEATGVFAQVRS